MLSGPLEGRPGGAGRHFADSQALLDALAEAGFGRLGDEVRAAIDDAGEDWEDLTPLG